MGMRRDTRTAAAASILLLAAGTGAANATNPFGESFAAGIAFIGAVGKVDVEVTEFTFSDPVERRLTIRWSLRDEDSSIANRRSGYCMRVSVGDAAWEEKCVDGAPSSATTYPRVTVRYYADIALAYRMPGDYRTKAQVKMRYGQDLYTSWSAEHHSWLTF